MKINIDDNKIVIYINKKNLKINYLNKQLLEDYVKDLILKIKKIYKVKIAGSYEVSIYENRFYGIIMEFVKIESLDFFPDLIDLKLNILYDSDIYLELDDYFLIKKYKEVYYFKDKYYLSINNMLSKDRIILSEFCNYIYGNKLNFLKENLVLV